MPVKKFENRSIFGKGMDKNLWLTFWATLHVPRHVPTVDGDRRLRGQRGVFLFSVGLHRWSVTDQKFRSNNSRSRWCTMGRGDRSRSLKFNLSSLSPHVGLLNVFTFHAVNRSYIQSYNSQIRLSVWVYVMWYTYWSTINVKAQGPHSADAQNS